MQSPCSWLKKEGGYSILFLNVDKIPSDYTDNIQGESNGRDLHYANVGLRMRPCLLKGDEVPSLLKRFILH
jgi:hypothetical protein